MAHTYTWITYVVFTALLPTQIKTPRDDKVLKFINVHSLSCVAGQDGLRGVPVCYSTSEIWTLKKRLRPAGVMT